MPCVAGFACADPASPPVACNRLVADCSSFLTHVSSWYICKLNWQNCLRKLPAWICLLGYLF
jgi:hypothetical protein